MVPFHRDRLTLSAEVFAVVGVADVVLGHVIALTKLATAAANASSTAREMRVRLQSLAGAISAVRSWAESYPSSDFATQDDQRVSDHVIETLHQCSARIGAIYKTLRDAESGASGTFSFARLRAGFQFARDEEVIRQAMSDLSSHTESLQLAMQVRQGTDMAIVRHQQTLHGKSTAENHTALKSGVDTILQTTSALAGVTELNHAVTLARFDDLRRSQAATQATLQACTNAILTTVQLTTLNDEEVLVEGDNLSAGVDALQYLNKYLSHSLRSLAECDNGMVLPKSLAALLTGEVDKMIRYSKHCNRAGTDPLLARADFNLPRRVHTIPIQIYGRPGTGNSFIAIESAEGEDSLGRRVQHVRFTAFSIRPSGDGSAILGLISLIDPAAHQQIRRQLRVLNIIPSDSPVFSLVEADDVRGIKELLAEGKASVLDYSEHGFGLFWVCYT